MLTNVNGVQEAKKLNEQSRQNKSGMTSAASTGSSNSIVEETKQLNAQSASGNASLSSAATESMSSGVEEAKKLNEQSRKNKGK
jgi:hypothetical protein